MPGIARQGPPKGWLPLPSCSRNRTLADVHRRFLLQVRDPGRGRDSVAGRAAFQISKTAAAGACCQ